MGTDELLTWRLTSEGISLQVLKRGEIILTIGTFRFNSLYKRFWGQRVDAITPASFLRYGTLHSAQRVEGKQRAVLGLTLSPDPCLLRDGISQLVRARDRESAHQAGGFGRWTCGSQLHPACCAVGSPTPHLAFLYPCRMKSGCLLPGGQGTHPI